MTDPYEDPFDEENPEIDLDDSGDMAPESDLDLPEEV